MHLTETDIKPFLGDNFLLDNRTAEILYHEYAAHQPILDYHNHLPPAQIADDHIFPNLTAIWLNGDHYKWRAMRTLGVAEEYITGDASDSEKFKTWAAAVPYTARNPLFHWTHLELQRYFNIPDLLNPKTADAIYRSANEMLNTPEFSTRNLIDKMRVEVICTTDDPVDDLHYHAQLKEEQTNFRMLPAFRPDKSILIEKEGFQQYIALLGTVANISIASFDDLLQALAYRMDYFGTLGCRLADHGLEQICADDFTHPEVNRIFISRLEGTEVSSEQANLYKSAILYHLGTMYAARGWVQQFHLGAMRSVNSRMLQALGPDTGYDSIGDYTQATTLGKYFNRLDSQNSLAKTIIYNLNPADNEIFATMIGNYHDGKTKGKMQFGSAWWFLDQKQGMTDQLNALSNMGLLSCFIGMLTDSRSFMSFPRHEYFRRLLCNLIGRDVHRGELPDDTVWLGGIIEDICYKNAKTYFEL